MSQINSERPTCEHFFYKLLTARLCQSWHIEKYYRYTVVVTAGFFPHHSKPPEWTEDTKLLCLALFKCLLIMGATVSHGVSLPLPPAPLPTAQRRKIYPGNRKGGGCAGSIRVSPSVSPSKTRWASCLRFHHVLVHAVFLELACFCLGLGPLYHRQRLVSL